MAVIGTQYLYADNTEWKKHPISPDPCLIQVQYGDLALLHFGALPDPAHPEVYEGVRHMHLKQGEPFWYHGVEEIWVRAYNNNVAGIKQKVKVACTPLVNT